MAANWKAYLYKGLWLGLDLIFPPACGGCEKTGVRWCATCQKNVPKIEKPFCVVCGLPQIQKTVCVRCENRRPAYKVLRSWAAFDSPVREALHKLKYRRDMALGEALSAQMAGFLLELDWPLDVLVPVPLGRKRMKERGYNQVAMIAMPLAEKLNLEYAPRMLARVRETKSQVGLSAEERLKNVGGAFQASTEIAGKVVLLVDDVATTGATLSSGAEALYASGAADVYAFTAARALARHGLHLV
ncbi:MAG: ComF family protein [Anaerolineales bacterium]